MIDGYSHSQVGLLGLGSEKDAEQRCSILPSQAAVLATTAPLSTLNLLLHWCADAPSKALDLQCEQNVCRLVNCQAKPGQAFPRAWQLGTVSALLNVKVDDTTVNTACAKGRLVTRANY